MNTAAFLTLALVLGLSIILFSTQASGQIQIHGLDHPGIKWAWPINTDNYTFLVNTTSNYDMKNVTFNKDTKTLTFLGNSSHTGNIAEIEIPKNLISGNFTIYQDGKQVSPIILKNANLTTVMLTFNDSGSVKTDIAGTTYLPEFSGIVPVIMAASFGMLFLTWKYRRI